MGALRLRPMTDEPQNPTSPEAGRQHHEHSFDVPFEVAFRLGLGIGLGVIVAIAVAVLALVTLSSVMDFAIF